MILKDVIFSRTSIETAKKGLDAAALRSRTIAANIANAQTPGYQRIEVEFESQLRKALDNRNVKGAEDQAGHMPLGRPDLSQVQAAAFRSTDPTMAGEVNNVDIDMEMAKLAENQILFQFGVKFIGARKGDIMSAIKGQAT